VPVSSSEPQRSLRVTVMVRVVQLRRGRGLGQSTGWVGLGWVACYYFIMTSRNNRYV